MERGDAQASDEEQQRERHVPGSPSEEAHRRGGDPGSEDDDPTQRGSVGEVADERLEQRRELEERRQRPCGGVGERELLDEGRQEGSEERGVGVVDGVACGDRCHPAGLEHRAV